MLIFDVETDSLLDELTRVHTMHVLDNDTGECLRFNEGKFADGSPAPRNGSIADGLQLLMKADEVCGHNVINFDIPAVTKIYPWFKLRADCVVHDTLIYARLIWPHIKQIDQAAIKRRKRPDDFAKRGLLGSHKLEAWGVRLGVLKNDYSGSWSHFTQELEEYAEQDPVTTKALWDKIVEKDFGGNSAEAVRLEHDTAHVIGLQQRFGFLFNKEEAEKLEGVLRARRAELYDQLVETFGSWFEPERKHGKVVVMEPKRDDRKFHYTKGCPLSKVKLVTFNPGSRKQIADRLIKLYGWVPVEFTDTGQPQVDETTLGSLDHIPAAQVLIDFLTVEKRLGQLADGDRAWLKYVQTDGRIHGSVNTLGAITRRMTHSYPNMAQVPSLVNAKGPVPYGAECRSLFTVAAGNKLCGCDAEGLELRMLAHYMAKFDGGSYGDTVVNGDKNAGTDVHTVNQHLLGMNSRNGAKTWIYAYLYGAGLLKLGMIIYEDFGGNRREAFNAKHEVGQARERAIARLGAKAKKSVEEGLPALGKLQELVKKLAARGYLKTLDGGLLKVRSAHAALNTLLQGSGAVVLKKALVLFHEGLLSEGWEPDVVTGVLRRGTETLGYVANVHDEWQIEVSQSCADEIGQRAADAMRRAGEALKVRCPLSGSYGLGSSWAETH